MALISLRSRSRVMASMVLTRAVNLFIHNYIRSLLYIYIYICYFKTYSYGPNGA